jgi:ATP-dependent helicase/nuclease subunit A
MPDQAARDRIRTALGETLFVEAGAGTGKTTALVERIVELVATRTATLAEIAAITFTDAAAVELRSRVRRRLEDAAVAEECPERRLACDQGAAQADQAAILTFHGFAQRLLAEHPLEAGLPPSFEVADEVSSQLIFEQWWSQLLNALLAEPTLAEPLLDSLALGMRVDHLRELARAFDRDYDRLEDPGVLPSPGPDPEPVGHLVAALAAASACRDWCTDANDKLAVHLDGLARLCARLDQARTDRERLRLFSGARLRFTRGQSLNWGGRVAEVRGRLAELQDRCDALLAARRRHALAPLLVRLREATLDAAAQRAEQGRLEYHDLLVHARVLLRDHPKIRERLARRYRFLLIDEFQDTDPLQVEIALRLAGEGGATGAADASEELGSGRRSGQGDEAGRLFFVGDAQQSIYRFRRADIATYERVRVQFRKGAVTLRQNYRSVPSILDWVNATFASLLDSGDDVGQAEHQPLQAHRPTTGDAPAVRLLGGPVDGRAAEVRNQESAAIAAAIAEIHGRWLVDDHARPARYQDIAILMPARTALPQLERALGEAGIPFRVEARSLIYATQEVRELLAILRAIDDPTDQVAIVAALRSPALGCTDRDLVDWRAAGGRWDYLAPVPVEDHVVASGLARLRCLHERRWWGTPSGIVEATIRELRLFELACVQGPGAFVESHRPREMWQRLRYVLDQARAFTERAASLRDFCAWIQRQADERIRVTEQVVPDDDDDAVRILTVHGAKGLEFPVTILCGLASPRRPPPGPMATWNGDGRMHVRVRKGFETDGFETAYARERRLEALEEVRLLYVAATRARDHLVVGVHHRPTNKEPGSAAERLWRLAQDTTAFWRPLVPTEDSRSLPTHRQPARPQEPATPREQWLAEREALITAHTMAPVMAGMDTDTRLPWQRGRARTALGRAVHAVLQTVDLSTGKGIDAMAAAQAAAEGLEGHGYHIATLARSVLTSREVLAALDARQYWRELFITATVEGITVEGFVDLLYEGPDGLVIVGYQTDPTCDAQLDVLIARSTPQVAAYALALEAVLDQPVVACRFVFAGDGSAREHAATDLAAAKAAVRAYLCAHRAAVTP